MRIQADPDPHQIYRKLNFLHLNVNGGSAFDENPEEAKVLPLSRPVQHSPPFPVLQHRF